MLIRWPSASPRATCCAAMRPPAPSLFSTITGWPRLTCSFSARMRAIVSDALPGETPETRRTVFEGKPCASARPDASSTTANAALRMIDSQPRRHPVRAARTVAVRAIVGDVVAVLDHEELDRPFRVGGDALGMLPRDEAVLLAGDEEKRAFDALRSVLHRERARMLLRVVHGALVAAYAKRFLR